jgi:hypothetical protein
MNKKLGPLAVDVRGRYNIIALNIGNCIRFEYITGSNLVIIIYPTSSSGYARETRLIKARGI